MTVNDTVCEHFGLNETDIIGMKLKDFIFKSFHNEFDKMMESLLDDTSNLVLIGNLFQVILSNGDLTLVSICIQKLNNDNEPKCLCMIEPVECMEGFFSINSKVIY